MLRSKAMDRAIKKYEQDKVDRVIFRVPKGMKEQIQEHAENRENPYLHFSIALSRRLLNGIIRIISEQ